MVSIMDFVFNIVLRLVVFSVQFVSQRRKAASFTGIMGAVSCTAGSCTAGSCTAQGGTYSVSYEDAVALGSSTSFESSQDFARSETVFCAISSLTAANDVPAKKEQAAAPAAAEKKAEKGVADFIPAVRDRKNFLEAQAYAKSNTPSVGDCFKKIGKFWDECTASEGEESAAVPAEGAPASLLAGESGASNTECFLSAIG